MSYRERTWRTLRKIGASAMLAASAGLVASAATASPESWPQSSRKTEATSVMNIQPIIVRTPDAENKGYTPQQIDRVYRTVEDAYENDLYGSIDINPRRTTILAASSTGSDEGGECYSWSDIYKFNDEVQKRSAVGREVPNAYFLDNPYCREPGDKSKGLYAFDRKDLHINLFMPGLISENHGVFKKKDPSRGLGRTIAHETGHYGGFGRSNGLDHMGELRQSELGIDSLEAMVAQRILRPASTVESTATGDPDIDEYASYDSVMGSGIQDGQSIITVAEMAQVSQERFRIPVVPIKQKTYEVSVHDPSKPAGIALRIPEDSPIQAIGKNPDKIVVAPSVYRDSDTGVTHYTGFDAVVQGEALDFSLGELNDMCREDHRTPDGKEIVTSQPLFIMNNHVIYGNLHRTRTESEPHEITISLVPTAGDPGLATCKQKIDERRDMMVGD